MPELPEVQALVADLGSRLTGRRIARLDVTAFAALKTYDPAPSVLTGATFTAVSRHGKFLDLTAVGAATEDKPVHLIVHLARAGWLRWRENAPAPGAGRGKGPIAARLVLDDGSGFDLTEADIASGSVRFTLAD
jgi:formamidopyrimidine-DNA glycosylase